MLSGARHPGNGDDFAVVTPAQGLNEAQLKAIAALESRVVAADGGRLKLEWGALRERPAAEVRDFLVYDDAQTLIGFAGLYAFGLGTPEITGMVDPDARRHGIGTALLNAALAECRRRDTARALLVVPRSAAAGSRFAAAHGGVLEHSEHAMVLAGEPAPEPEDPALTLRLATVDDVPAFGAILSEAFPGPAPSGESTVFETPRSRRLVAERGGEVIGTINLVWDEDDGRVYAFAITPKLRGQGIGRDVLRRACLELRARGAARVGLEVLTDNDRALALYESLGFARTITEDYYEFALR